MYDYLVVGSGLYGATFAQQAKAHGKSVLVIDKRPNIAGNVYTEKVEGINFHKYGAHIFHTNNREVWEYLQQFTVFNRFTNSPVANYKGELYAEYKKLADGEKKVIFGGRLGEYKYYDMDAVIASALEMSKRELKQKELI